MMKIEVGNFKVYRLSKDGEDYTIFQTPATDTMSYLTKANEVRKLKNKGFKVLCVVNCNQESFLNLRISDAVQEYLDADHYKERIKHQMRCHRMDEDTFWDTVKRCQDYQWYCLKVIDSLVRRCQKHDYDVWNEIALRLVDLYHQNVMY